jgi:hypothetical protein
MVESHETHHFTHAPSSANTPNTPILQKDSEVLLFESEIEMKKYKIILIIEIEIQSK